MSKARRIRRANERAAAKHFNVLGELLGEYYEFLERVPKPSEEKVRTEFINRENRWKKYCSSNQLNERATLLFNQEVAQSWKNRYAKNSVQTLN